MIRGKMSGFTIKKSNINDTYIQGNFNLRK